MKIIWKDCLGRDLEINETVFYFDEKTGWSGLIRNNKDFPQTERNSLGFRGIALKDRTISTLMIINPQNAWVLS